MDSLYKPSFLSLLSFCSNFEERPDAEQTLFVQQIHYTKNHLKTFFENISSLHLLDCMLDSLQNSKSLQKF